MTLYEFLSSGNTIEVDWGKNHSHFAYSKHIYVCDKCHYKTNDDRIAAMNIQLLGTLLRNNVISPSFRSKITAKRKFNNYQTYSDN